MKEAYIEKKEEKIINKLDHFDKITAKQARASLKKYLEQRKKRRLLTGKNVGKIEDRLRQLDKLSDEELKAQLKTAIKHDRMICKSVEQETDQIHQKQKEEAKLRKARFLRAKRYLANFFSVHWLYQTA